MNINIKNGSGDPHDQFLDFMDVKSIPIKQSLSKSFQENSLNNNGYSVSNDGKISKNFNARRKSIKSMNDEDEEDNEDRKKRDNMNDKIQELLGLIPDIYFVDNKDRSSGTKDGKPNKGQILTKGVEYIQDLQNKIDENNRKEVELIWKLKKLIKLNNGNVNLNGLNLNNTSAEIVLSEIGVGPLANTTSKKSPNNNFEYGGYDQYS